MTLLKNKIAQLLLPSATAGKGAGKRSAAAGGGLFGSLLAAIPGRDGGSGRESGSTDAANSLQAGQRVFVARIALPGGSTTPDTGKNKPAGAAVPVKKHAAAEAGDNPAAQGTAAMLQPLPIAPANETERMSPGVALTSRKKGIAGAGSAKTVRTATPKTAAANGQGKPAPGMGAAANDAPPSSRAARLEPHVLHSEAAGEPRKVRIVQAEVIEDGDSTTTREAGNGAPGRTATGERGTADTAGRPGGESPRMGGFGSEGNAATARQPRPGASRTIPGAVAGQTGRDGAGNNAAAGESPSAADTAPGSRTRPGDQAARPTAGQTAAPGSDPAQPGRGSRVSVTVGQRPVHPLSSDASAGSGSRPGRFARVIEGQVASTERGAGAPGTVSKAVVDNSEHKTITDVGDTPRRGAERSDAAVKTGSTESRVARPQGAVRGEAPLASEPRGTRLGIFRDGTAPANPRHASGADVRPVGAAAERLVNRRVNAIRGDGAADTRPAPGAASRQPSDTAVRPATTAIRQPGASDATRHPASAETRPAPADRPFPSARSDARPADAAASRNPDAPISRSEAVPARPSAGNEPRNAAVRPAATAVSGRQAPASNSGSGPAMPDPISASAATPARSGAAAAPRPLIAPTPAAAAMREAGGSPVPRPSVAESAHPTVSATSVGASASSSGPSGATDAPRPLIAPTPAAAAMREAGGSPVPRPSVAESAHPTVSATSVGASASSSGPSAAEMAETGQRESRGERDPHGARSRQAERSSRGGRPGGAPAQRDATHSAPQGGRAATGSATAPAGAPAANGSGQAAADPVRPADAGRRAAPRDAAAASDPRVATDPFRPDAAAAPPASAAPRAEDKRHATGDRTATSVQSILERPSVARPTAPAGTAPLTTPQVATVQQVVQALASARQARQGRLSMSVDGGDLGRMDLHFSRDGEESRAVIVVESEASRAVMQRLLPAIQDALQDRGIRFQSFELSTDEERRDSEAGARRHGGRQDGPDPDSGRQDGEGDDRSGPRRFGYNTMEVSA